MSAASTGALAAVIAMQATITAANAARAKTRTKMLAGMPADHGYSFPAECGQVTVHQSLGLRFWLPASPRAPSPEFSYTSHFHAAQKTHGA